MEAIPLIQSSRTGTAVALQFELDHVCRYHALQVIEASNWIRTNCELNCKIFT